MPKSSHIAWQAIPIAGLTGGTVFLLVNAILSNLLLDINPTLVLRYDAALVAGQGILTDTNDAYLILGVLVHYILAILFSTLIAIVVYRWGLTIGMLGGAILGLSLYSLNFYTMTLIFDWYFALNGTVMVIAHIAYGAVTGGVYEMLDQYDIAEVHHEAQ